MTGLRMDDLPAEIRVEATADQLVIRLGRERDPAHSLFDGICLTFVLASLLFIAAVANADPDLILGVLGIAVLGILWLGRGPRVEVIRIDRDALVHERRVRSIRRTRSYNTHILKGVTVLRARWPGADSLSRQLFGPGRCYLAVSAKLHDESLAWLDQTLQDALVWFQRPHPELGRASDPGRLVA